MPIRMSGMNSGLDTDSIVRDLVKAQGAKKEKLVKAQTLLQWKQESFKALNTKIYSFFNTSLANMKFSEAYNKKSTTVSNPNIASVIAGNNAATGTQSLIVKQLAKAGYLTGGKLSSGSNIKGTSKLNDELNAGLSGTGDINVTVGGKTSTISVTADTTIDGVVDQLNKAGLKASFDQVNQRIFINVAESGVSNDFSISAGNAEGLKAMSALGLVSSADFGPDGVYKQWAKYQGATDADTTANLKAAGIIDSTTAERASDMQKQIAAAVKRIADLDKQLNDPENGYIKKLTDIKNSDEYKNITGSTSADKLQNASDAMNTNTDKLTFLALSAKPESERTEDEKAKFAVLEKKSQDENWGPLDKDTLLKEQKELNASLSKIKSAIALEGSIQANKASIYKEQSLISENATIVNKYYTDRLADPTLSQEEKDKIQKTIDLNNDYILKADTYAAAYAAEKGDSNLANLPKNTYDLTDKVTKELVEKVNTAANAVANAGSLQSGSAVRVIGQDAIAILNGAEYTSKSNNFSVNGLTITAKEISQITGYQDVDDGSGNIIKKPIYLETSINTDQDINGVYNMICDFFKGYNSLIKEMDSMYNAKSAKGYEPLTDEEKDAMTDSQIEDWEKRVKEGMMRRDGTIQTIVNSMKFTMLSTIQVDGKPMNLSSFGIETLGYFDSSDNERGVYHIDGNPNDPNSSAKPDKLKTALADDPKAVMSFFTELTGDMHEKLNNQMRSSKYRSVYTVYDDKKMKTEYDNYTKKIQEQEKRITALEERYYKQFSAMEVALSKLNSSQSALGGLLGGK